MNIPVIPLDKANHVAYGALAGLAAAWAAVALGHPEVVRAAALGVAVVMGAAKEAADYVLNKRAAAAGLPPPHGVEWRDFLATVIGGALIAGAP